MSPKRLIGIAAISVYDIDEAVKELERCAKAGIKGSIIWQAPHPDLPFHSEHYNKFWAASQDLEHSRASAHSDRSWLPQGVRVRE